MALLQQVANDLIKERSPSPELVSFQAIRKAVGWLGVLLPFALWGGGVLISGTALQPSISHYYFTNMREIFVGVLCAVSLFLFTYKGYSKLDSYSANLAGIFSLLVAVFPTNIISSYPGQVYTISLFDWKIHNAIHLISAALFFVTLACMSLFLFTKSNKPKAEWTAARKNRNRTYILCGWGMIICIILIGVSGPLFGLSSTSKITFILEAVALILFGVSWLTKGEMLFGDKE